MDKYPSIETVFLRDPATHKLLFGEVREPEVGCVAEWTLSEKIDGTNMRVIVDALGIEVKGRTDAAQLKPALVEHIKSLFDHEIIVDYFAQQLGPSKVLHDEWAVTFYGEGYGPGIGPNGKFYTPKYGFRCFDLKYGHTRWADDSAMRDTCRELKVPVVPELGYINHYEIPETPEELRTILPYSAVARAENPDGPGYAGEGIVAKPHKVLLNAFGGRVMWKLTFREWDEDKRRA